MNFEPQKFFIGLMEFSSIQLTGVLLSYLLMDGIYDLFRIRTQNWQIRHVANSGGLSRGPTLLVLSREFVREHNHAVGRALPIAERQEFIRQKFTLYDMM